MTENKLNLDKLGTFLSSFLGSGSVGDDDLWHHYVGGFSPFSSFSSFLFPSGLPAGPCPKLLRKSFVDLSGFCSEHKDQ